jgi:origin recognition complex subunit 4
MMKTQDRTERKRLEQDFAGEFGKVRWSGMEASADKLISGKKPVNVLAKIPLLNSSVDQEWEDDQRLRSPLSSDSAGASSKRNASLLQESLSDMPKVKLPKLIRIENSQEADSNSSASPRISKLSKLIRMDDSQYIVQENGPASPYQLPKLIRVDSQESVREEDKLQTYGIAVKVEPTTPKKLHLPDSTGVTIPLITMNLESAPPREISQRMDEKQQSTLSLVSNIPEIKTKRSRRLRSDKSQEHANSPSSSPVKAFERDILPVPKDSTPESVGDHIVIDIDSDSDSESESEFFDCNDMKTIEFTKDAPSEEQQSFVRESGSENSTERKDSRDSETTKLDGSKKESQDKNGENTPEERRPDSIPAATKDAQLVQLRNKILMKLHGKSQTDPYEIDDKLEELYNIVHSTVRNGEKHSCFVFGPRNSGKTAALNSVLRRLRSESSESIDEDFIVININGLAQRNDTLAVRAIAEQLDSEISRIYNVNLRDLEAKELLSRKSITNTFANILQVLDKEILLNDGEVAKIRHPVIFCIDEVDVYAHQNRQTLLYNLFELVEYSQTPVCVLCFTSNFTVKDLLEKRVRSRFSQRYLHFRKLPQEKFLTVAKRILQVDEPSNELESEWNEKVELLIDGNTKVRRILIQNHMTINNIKEFQNCCVYPLSMLTTAVLNDQDFAKYLEDKVKQSYVKVVNSLSDIEILLLVSAARVIAKTDMSWVNLNMVYEEYVSELKSRSREIGSGTGFGAVASTGLKTWSKDSCKSPWETLVQHDFLTIPGLGRTDFTNNALETRMWQVELTLDELRLIVDSRRIAKSWTRL